MVCWSKWYDRFLARKLSGLYKSPMEVTDETDRDAAGDPGYAIYRGLFKMDREAVNTGRSGRDFRGQ